ncbi:FKBP-type peptidyl-prolyl cis-trans isomerase [Gryllotalpicola koreensis]|uniref:Peptidyl-prolyl cis-trans isomerase n=1 Tax=Gryllotalpicola koreensis TaxID=993086 RepID=A0ABP8AAP7_9MICO
MKSGSASDSVTVTGDQKSAPKITFKKGISAKSEQRSVLITGSGEKAQEGSAVTIAFTAYNGTSGDPISDPVGYDTSQDPYLAQLGPNSSLPLFNEAIECLQAGSRVAYVAPAATAFGGESNLSQTGLTKSDSVVMVADVLKVVPQPAISKADGAAQQPAANFPTVKLAGDGTPTITLPKTQSLGKTTTDLEVLKKGTGATVKDGDVVTAHYIGMDWTTGKVFDSSWSRGKPSPFLTDQVVSGFTKALVGHTVGSQIEAVIPPAEGYGSQGNSQAGIGATDTLVFVVDILGTTAAR